MEWHIQRVLNRVSLAVAFIATVALLHLFSRSPLSCSPPPSSLHPHHQTLTLTPFPRSSCDAAARTLLTPEKRFLKLRRSAAFRRRTDAFDALFRRLRAAGALSNASRALCVSAGAGHEVAALQDSGVADVTGVDLADYPPLVRRADPHNLPFFDGVFDIGFSAGLEAALFPARFVAEMERTVRRGGVEVLVVERGEVDGAVGLFRRSSLVEVSNVTLVGDEMAMIVMRNNGKPP